MMGSDEKEVPTYYANFVTMTINTDQLVMELRAVHPRHKDMWEKAGKPLPGEKPPTWGPPPSLEEIYNIPPIARVVVTIYAARGIKRYLDQTLDDIMARRQKGE